MLWNPETGIACTVALSFYVLIRFYSDESRSPWQPLTASAALASISLTLTFAGWAFFLRSFPHPRELLTHLADIAGNGYGGVKPKMGPAVVAPLLAIYASSLVIYCCYQASAGNKAIVTIERAAMAVAAIIWFAYYAHRPCCGIFGVFFSAVIHGIAPLQNDFLEALVRAGMHCFYGCYRRNISMAKVPIYVRSANHSRRPHSRGCCKIHEIAGSTAAFHRCQSCLFRIGSLYDQQYDSTGQTHFLLSIHSVKLGRIRHLSS